MIPFSVLDLSPIPAGHTAATSFRNTLDLARHAERWGYTRYWLAEHHNIPGIASAATSVVIGHVAAGTERIRVGAGGIMLPNHSPLVIAEQFGTLESVFPGRFDLARGRAPGSDPRTARALRRDLSSNADHFPQDVLELQALFGPAQPGQTVFAVPGTGLEVPLWILGSSLFGAQVAAAYGLPFGFASHFAPDALLQALQIYRARFQPSATLARPHAMAVVNVVVADTDREAERLFSSIQQQFANLYRGTPLQLQPPRETMHDYWTPQEQAGVDHTLRYACVGSPASVRAKLTDFLAMTGVDELMVTASLFEHRARLRSFELAMDVRATLSQPAAA